MKPVTPTIPPEIIPLDKIREEPRLIASSWADSYIWIGDKHKLASDIQNYADKYNKEQIAEYQLDKLGYHITKSREQNIRTKLEDLICNGVVTGEEVDITTSKVFDEFVLPLLRLIDNLKTP